VPSAFDRAEKIAVHIKTFKPQIKKQTGRSVSVDGSSLLGWIWGVYQSKIVILALSIYVLVYLEFGIKFPTVLRDI